MISVLEMGRPVSEDCVTQATLSAGNEKRRSVREKTRSLRTPVSVEKGDKKKLDK
jgi:hypothetical protein